jgi:hypothetical protein
MPLIRALRRWIGRRMEVREPYGQTERLNQAGWGSQATGMGLLIWRGRAAREAALPAGAA